MRLILLFITIMITGECARVRRGDAWGLPFFHLHCFLCILYSIREFLFRESLADSVSSPVNVQQLRRDRLLHSAVAVIIQRVTELPFCSWKPRQPPV